MAMDAGGVTFLDTMQIYRFTQIHRYMDEKYGGGYRSICYSFLDITQEEKRSINFNRSGTRKRFCAFNVPGNIIFANPSLRRSRIG